MKNYLILVLFLLTGNQVRAQEQVLDIVAGAIYPLRTDKFADNATPKVGLNFGLLYRIKNEKGIVWSAGANYQLLQNKKKVLVNNKEAVEKEKFELFNLNVSPLVWLVGKKKRGFIEIGGFANYLLHEESELQSNLVNNTKKLRRLSLGPRIGVGLQLGETMRKSVIIGLHNDYGAISIGKNPSGGKAIPLTFNTISLYLGLGI